MARGWVPKLLAKEDGKVYPYPFKGARKMVAALKLMVLQTPKRASKINGSPQQNKLYFVFTCCSVGWGHQATKVSEFEPESSFRRKKKNGNKYFWSKKVRPHVEWPLMFNNSMKSKDIRIIKW